MTVSDQEVTFIARVLLVDDDRMICRLYAKALRAEDFIVTECYAAEEALDRLLKGEIFDLLITDIMMAKMDGWELLDTVRKGLRLDALALPVIIISAFESSELEEKAFLRGASGCLIKPVVPLSKLINLAKIHTGRVRSKYHAT